MEELPGIPLTANVVQYDVKRIAVGRLLVPVSALSYYFQKYDPSPAAGVISAALMAAAIATLLIGRRSYGWRPLRASRKGISVGDEPVEIVADVVSSWTLDGVTARLYGGQKTWRLRARSNESERLERLLTQRFGPSLVLHYRGSRRARAMAGLVALVGVALIAASVALNAAAMIVVGIFAAGLGVATFAALSQKATKPEPRR